MKCVADAGPQKGLEENSLYFKFSFYTARKFSLFGKKRGPKRVTVVCTKVDSLFKKKHEKLVNSDKSQLKLKKIDSWFFSAWLNFEGPCNLTRLYDRLVFLVPSTGSSQSISHANQFIGAEKSSLFQIKSNISDFLESTFVQTTVQQNS